MMRLLGTALFLLATCATPALAIYRPVPLHQLAGAADEIVVARISKVAPNSLTLIVERTVLGKSAEAAPLVIGRFRNWACARRYAPHAVGQRALWFLRRQPARSVRLLARPRDQALRVISAGNEGELPLQGEHAYYKGSVPRALGKAARHTLGQAPYWGTRWRLDQLIQAVRGFRELFRYGTSGHWRDLARIRQTGSAEAVAAFRRRSPVHELLVRAATRDWAFKK